MLKDTITYGGQTLLTVYHDNDELDVPGRHWRESEKVGRFWLEFAEHSICAVEEIKPEDPLVEQLLLPHDHPLAPVGSHEFCTLMTRRRTQKKPDHVFSRGGDKLCLAPEHWEQLCQFVKRYTGLDLAKAPMACGDTFIFHYIQLRYHAKQASISVDPGTFDRIELHFKRGEAVWEMQSRRFPSSGRGEMEFTPTEDDWDSFDIYAYAEDKLWFYAKDVAFMQRIQFTMNWGRDRAIHLQSSNYSVHFSNGQNQEIITVGEEKRDLRLEQKRQEARLLSSLSKKSERSTLISKGSDFTVYSMANKILDRHWDEVRLFDPYLLDKKGREALVDWMRLLRGSPAVRICAIYYRKASSDLSLTLAEAKKFLSLDWTLSQQLRRYPNTLQLLGINEYIHDRFLLCREKDQFSGLALGTSINSINSNYFCVHSLSDAFARECWETFAALLPNHTTESEVL